LATPIGEQVMESAQTERATERARVPLIVPVVLVGASAVSIFSTDFYAPSLPHLPAYFDTTPGTVQLSMSLNLAAFALAQLVHGPLADRYGRRFVILAGMIGFALASIGCALSESVGSLIGFRIMQGLTVSAEAVVVMAVIRDLWDEMSGAKVMAAYGMAVAMAPAVGPIIGGIVHVTWGWQANFWILTALAVVSTAALWRFLPETRPASTTVTGVVHALRGYYSLLGNRAYLGYAVISGMVMGGLFAFITEGPFLLINRHGVLTQHYGYYQAVIVLAYFFGSLFANRFVARMGIEPLLRLGLLIQVVGALSLFPVILTGLESPVNVTAVVSLFVFALGLVFSTAPIRALSVASTGGGAAAALLGAVEVGFAALGAFAVGLLHDGTAMPTAYVLGGSSLLAVLAYGLTLGGPPAQQRSGQ